MNIYIKVIEQCNLKCSHCYNIPKSNKEINYGELKKALSKLNDDDYFILHGGEPMLANTSSLLDLVRSFPNNKWRISTNLVYNLTKEKIELFKLMDEIRVSFDIKIRFNNINNLILWYKNIRKLINLGLNIKLNICITPYLIKHDPSYIYKFINNLGVNSYNFERITLTGKAKDDLIANYEDIENWLCKLYYLDKEHRCNDINMIRLGIQGHSEFCYGRSCCRNTMTINSDLTIGNCPNTASCKVLSNNDDIVKTANNINKCNYKIRKECLICNYFKYCHGWCNEISWQNNKCSYPKKLADIILGEITYDNKYL